MNRTLKVAEALQNPQKLQVVYIAGKVTGLPYPDVYTKFKVVQTELEKSGFFVLNPCDHIAPACDWDEAMRTALMLLLNADHIYLLSDWHLSEGAKIEKAMADILSINTMEGLTFDRTAAQIEN